MPGLIEETSEDGWRASIEGNLTATFLTIKSILPGMKQRKAGVIITISLRGRPQASPASTHTLFRRQGRNPNSDPGRCRASWTLRNSRQLHSPRDHPHRATSNTYPKHSKAHV
jgi:NAD(P)-dependent dehydrogenase (short-subunit alcohol dehydrogenase family)